MSHPTPDQVLEQRRRVLLDQDTEGFVALFAPEGAIELPFAGPNMPTRLDGQQAIRDFTRRSTAGPIHLDDLEVTAVHHTADPEVIIVELVTRATITSTGRTFTGRSIQVFRIRDGQIVLFRDYFNPRGLDELIGA
jgi:ketosteroid isomerase-like protein